MIIAKRIKPNIAGHHHLDHHHLRADRRISTNNDYKQESQTEREDGAPMLPSLIPGLPDHMAETILAKLPASVLYAVCTTWRRLLYSPHFPSPFPSLYILSTPKNQNQNQNQTHIEDNPSPISLLNYDPVSSSWSHISPPRDPAAPLKLLLRHPSFLSRNLPIQSLSVANSSLVLLAATTTDLHPALPRPLVFSPATASWSHGPPIPVPRRWCAVGALSGAVFVASGIGTHFSSDVARSVEKWDMRKGGIGTWERLSGLRDGWFCREAIEAVGWKGRKLCMVNVKGDAAKEGAVYDVDGDKWEEMSEGMRKGWRGPAVAAATEEVIYSVDESRGALRRYVEEKDVWMDVVVDERLRGAQQMAASGGRVCVVGGDGGSSGVVVVVDVVAMPARVWSLGLPDGFDAVAAHILPRMSRP